MKKNFQRLAFVSLFVLSIGAAGATFASVAYAGHPKCPTCDANNGCVGSTCSCKFEGGNTFSCEANDQG